MSNVKNIIANRAQFNALCAANGASTFMLNVGLIASERFSSEAQARVLSGKPNTVQALKIPQIVSEIIADFEAIGYKVIDGRMAQSETEPTAVLYLQHGNAKNTYNELNKLSSKYAQDCIALTNGTDGILLGEYNHIWGDFNPEYFIDF